MCAIAGIFNLKVKPETLEKMLASMARRGPDGRGIHTGRNHALLHTRLAIVDPEGGAQPMTTTWAGETYTIVYNGELYNTQELRRELEGEGHRFFSHSDTEVVLHAYAHWGRDCVNRFNGIFALAVWEEKSGKLFLARDRIGVKPLFYSLHQGGLLFASEIKTLFCYPTLRPRLNAQGAAQILMFGPGRLPGSGVFSGISELEPGCWGFYQDGKLQVNRYWKLTDREHRDNFDDTCDHVRALVTDAILRQMVSDYPVGTFLSGGLDSSIISAVCAGEMKNRGEVLHTFSVDYLNNEKYFTPGKFQPNSDGMYIDLMCRTIGSQHHATVLTPQNLLDALQDATIARDLPGMADVDFSLLAFCREVRPHVKVALSGECADEIFGGYPWYRDPDVRAQEGFPWAQNLDFRKQLLHPDIDGQIKAKELVMDAYRDTCAGSDILPGTSDSERRMKEMVNLNFSHFMQTLLDRKDRMSMYCGLEVRVPFCDYRIAEYLYGAPWEYKNYRNQEKGLLRYAMAEILPESVLWRKKSPYPKTHDPKYAQIVGKCLQDLLSDSQAPIFSLVDRKTVSGLFTSEPIWPWYGQLMRTPQTMAWLLQLDFWLRWYEVDICF